MGNGASTSTKILERQGIFSKGSGKNPIFSGDNENLIKNGKTLLEERISLFNGRTNPLRCFSVDNLNSMNIENDPLFREGHYESYKGVWEGKLVLVKVFREYSKLAKFACREIAVATQMGTHRNAHRLLGCCLNTNYPVLVYQWVENGTLHDRILDYKKQSKEPLKWKERIQMGWEIAHAVAYLHTAFPRPIIHRDLKPRNVYLDEDGAAKLSDFSLSVSIPEGKNHIQEENLMGTIGHIAPEYMSSLRVTEGSDVFAFGVLLLILLTGKPGFKVELDHGWNNLRDWVRDCLTANGVSGIIDPTISTNIPAVDVKALVGLALRCSSEEEEYRPTMVDVATQLKDMIMSSSDTL